MKTIAKILLISLIYLILFILVSGILPYSPEYQNLLETSASPTSVFWLWLLAFWNSLVIFLIIKHSTHPRIKVWILLSAYLFMLLSFMSQIETWFFNDSFTALSNLDVMLIMLSPVLAIMVSVMAGLKLFAVKTSITPHNVPVRNLIPKLLIIGLLFTIIYFAFGYYVAWQFEALRLFYSGSAEKVSFFQIMMNNIQEYQSILPFQFIRGIAFGLINYILYHLLASNKKIYVLSSVLSNMAFGILLLIPNPLFPDEVRMAHFYEVTSSMVLFSLLMCRIFLWKRHEAY